MTETETEPCQTEKEAKIDGLENSRCRESEGQREAEQDRQTETSKMKR